MALKEEFSRIQHKIITGVGVVPTIPVDLTDEPKDDWLITDLMTGEICVNTDDDKAWIRLSTGIIEFATSIASLQDLQEVLDEGSVATIAGNVDITADNIIFLDDSIKIGNNSGSASTTSNNVRYATFIGAQDASIDVNNRSSIIIGGLRSIIESNYVNIDSSVDSSIVNVSEYCSIIGNDSSIINSSEACVITGGLSNIIEKCTYCAILGGANNNITSFDESVILGGNTIIADADRTAFTNNLRLELGGRFRVLSGSNAISGSAALTAGTVTINTNKVQSSSIILLTHQDNSGTIGFVTVSARVANTSFTITSSSATDTSIIGWLIIDTV